jgi:hypothetical protein
MMRMVMLMRMRMMTAMMTMVMLMVTVLVCAHHHAGAAGLLQRAGGRPPGPEAPLLLRLYG